MPARVPIAIFLTSFDPGGTEGQTLELVRRLSRERFDVHVACFRREGAWLPRAEEAASTLTAFPIRGFGRAGTVSQARAFGRWCRQKDIRLLYTADLYANTFGQPAAAVAGVPVRIASRRELNPGRSAAQIALQRAAYMCARRIVANCAAAASRLVSEGVARHRIHVIPNGIDLERYRPPTPARSIRRLVVLANLRPEKAHEVLFEALVAVARRAPDVELVVAGDGPRRLELERLAGTLGLESRVRFLGHSDSVPALLASCDAFVLPSRSEAFPNCVLEAMAAGLPIVASRVGGILELIDHQRTGVLVTPDDAQALAYALLDIIQWPEHAAALGQAARRAVEARYSLDRMVAAYEQLYLEELARHAAPSPEPSEVVAS